MKRKYIFLLLLLIFVFTGFSLSQNTPVTKANYKLAARFSPEKIKKMVFSTSVDPHWLKLSDRFWYLYETPEGKTFYIVDPVRKRKSPIFDNAKMAAMLTKIIKDPYDAQHIPIKKIKFVKGETAIRFEVESSQEEKAEEKKKEEKKEKKKEKEKKKKEEKKKIYYFEYDLKTGKLTHLKDYEKPPKRPKWASIAPDSQKVIFARHHNLYWMDWENYLKALEDEEDSTIVEHQLTTDGVEYYGYEIRTWGETNVDKEKNKDKRKPVSILWSRDSKICNDSHRQQKGQRTLGYKLYCRTKTNTGDIQVPYAWRKGGPTA